MNGELVRHCDECGRLYFEAGKTELVLMRFLDVSAIGGPQPEALLQQVRHTICHTCLVQARKRSGGDE